MNKLIILIALLFINTALAVKRAPYQDGPVFIEWDQNHTLKIRQKMLEKIAKIGSKHVTMVLFGCQSTITSADIRSCNFFNDDYLFETVGIARKLGFQVTLLPILTTPNWDWRGLFKPKNVSEWFKNYRSWITRLAMRSQESGIIELVIASEISGLYQYPKEWIALANHLRTYFSGNLIITANWDYYDFEFWPAVDAIGISAYFPIAETLNPTYKEMLEKWALHKKKLLAVSLKYNRPLHFTELGYESVSGAAKTPWAAPTTGAVDFAHQEACFRAFAETWKNEKALLRTSVWATDDSEMNYDRSFEIMGKPAQKVLEEYFYYRNAL